MSIYWPRYKRYYDGTVTEYATGRGEHVVKYDVPDETGESDFYERLLGGGKVKWRELPDDEDSDSSD